LFLTPSPLVTYIKQKDICSLFLLFLFARRPVGRIGNVQTENLVRETRRNRFITHVPASWLGLLLLRLVQQPQHFALALFALLCFFNAQPVGINAVQHVSSYSVPHGVPSCVLAAKVPLFWALLLATASLAVSADLCSSV